jgi:serine/threonine-protein kinase
MASTAAQCIEKLQAAGFGRFKQVPTASTPEQKDKVIGTLPPANQLSAVTNEITIAVGSGPNTKAVPDVKGLSPDQAQQVLTGSGFTAPAIVVQVDGSKSTSGQVVETEPPSGADVPVDTPIQVKVSKGNQFVMPSLRGMFWDDAYPLLQSLGWQLSGDNFVKLPNAQNSGVPSNGVVTQDPAPGTPVRVDQTITLSFAA